MTPRGMEVRGCSFTAGHWRESELTLSKDDISALLYELAGKLEVQGSHGDLFLVGGAAMALKVMAARSASEALDDVQLHDPHQTGSAWGSVLVWDDTY